jgi:hypothetical protein
VVKLSATVPFPDRSSPPSYLRAASEEAPLAGTALGFRVLKMKLGTSIWRQGFSFLYAERA